ncbi:ESPR-type extended signal peptide-containing protein [Stenotrophomonas sp. UBA7606]|uniref:ESPR-type extended signal peptide-containing protein n=1 Tax=Stenotrophomonas sp. UBA7606 TaxID=1947559 RepID=UPI0025FCF32C|nr:ESPR-type extended signal peptide-containing protein [Stenotrophomonas sp. UBA7606]
MNRIYRLVWNRTLNAFVVGSELASAHGKASGATKLHAPASALAWSGAAGMLALVMALPAHASDARLDDLQALVAKYSNDQTQQVLQQLPAANVQAGVGVGTALNIAVPSLIRADLGAAVKVQAQAGTAPPQARLQAAAKLRANVAVPVAGRVIGEVASAAAPVVQLLSGAAPGAPNAGGTAGLVNGLTNLLSPGKEEGGAPLRDTLAGVVGTVTGLGGTAQGVDPLAGLVSTAGNAIAPVLRGAGTNLGAVVGGATGSAAAGTVLASGVDHVAGVVHSTTQAVATVLSPGKEENLPLVGGVQQLVGGLTGALQGDTVTGAALGGVLDGVGQVGGEAVGALTGSAQLGGTVTGVVAGVADGVTQVTGLLGGVAAPGQGSDAALLGGVQQLVGGLTGALQGDTDAGAALGGVLDGVGQAGGEALGALTGSAQLGGTVTGAVAGVADGVTQVAGLLGGVPAPGQNSDAPLLGGVQQLVGGLTGALQGGNDAGATLGGVIDGAGEAVGGVLADVTGSTSLGGTVSNTVGVVGAGVDQATTALGGALTPNGQGDNPLAGAVTGVVGAVTDTVVGGVVAETGVGGLVDGVVDNTSPAVDQLGQGVGQLVTEVTGSGTLGSGLGATVDTLTDGLQQTSGSLAGGDVVGAVQDLLGAVDSTGNAALGAVGSTLGGLTGSASGVGGLTGAVGGVLSGVTNGLSNIVGQVTGTTPAAPPAAPVPPPPAAGGSLIVGNGGAVGTVGSVLAPTLSSVLGGNGYVQNGSLTINSANIAQGYTSVSVLGVPVVNLSPVGQLLDGVGGLATGGNSHMTLLGGVTSDSYIYNINNGDPNGLLGLLLPDQAPAWAAKCANVLGLVQVDCWGINAAQDYQVLIGDGAFANGSKEVVIGTNAQHRLAMQDANEVFAGNGVNDPNNPTGVPTADYDARLGHSVVIGDSAIGTANGQTLLGAGATSDKANSVALGYKSNAARGGMDNYSAFGLTAAQSSIGEVAVGSAGRERQITHVAAGSQATDAVNVAQLQGALSQINDVSLSAVLYDQDAGGNVDYTRVTLGGSSATTGTTLANLAGGALSAGSMEAVNGSQLYGMGQSLAGYIGGGAAFLADGTFSAPTYAINSIAASGDASLQDYLSIDTAFTSISDSLLNLQTLLPDGSDPLAVLYTADTDGNPTNEVSLVGDGSGASVALRNIAAGSLSLGSADAVNGGQLYGMGQSLAGYIGGGAAFLADGTFSAPTFKINSIAVGGQATLQDYLNFDSAFSSISDSLLNLSSLLPDGSGGSDPLAVLYSADAAGNPLNEVELIGDGSGAAVALRNVAAGAVVAGGADAVNGGQLFGLGQSIASYLGGGASLSATGTLLAPNYQIFGIQADGVTALGNFGNIGFAFDSISDSLVNLRNMITTGGGVGSALNVQYVADANGNPTNQVALTGAGDGQAVAVTNVANGQVVSGSLDAVNGGQLAATNQAVTQAIGGTMGFDPGTGLWTAPSFAVTSVSTSGGTNQVVLDNVTDALAAMDSSIVNVNNRIDNIQNGGAGSAYFAVNSTKPAASATGQDALAAGPQASASGSEAVAIGNGASASAAGSVALGAGSVADRDNAVSVGAAGKERQITNVADGTAATDAVNVRQLEASQQGTVRYDQNTDGSTNYGSVTMGKAGTSTVIHNVGTGTAPTDAVNVAQLNKGLGEVMDWSKNYTDQRFNDITRDIKRVDDRASAGIASAMAMAGLPQPSEAGRRMASFAASTFHGESSMAVGVSGVSDGGRWIYKLSGSANTRGDGGVTVGAGFQW